MSVALGRVAAQLVSDAQDPALHADGPQQGGLPQVRAVRVALRDLALRGDLPGVTKSSW